ncbi:unnamed protein product [Sphagnum balticum]
MVKTKINSKLGDLQISKLNEFFLVVDKIRKAGCGARQGFGKFKCNKLNPSGGGSTWPPSSLSHEIASANGSLVWFVHGSRKAPFAPNFPSPGRSLSKEGKIASQAPADSITPNDLERCHLPTKNAQAFSTRSDGESREGRLQRSSPPTSH